MPASLCETQGPLECKTNIQGPVVYAVQEKDSLKLQAVFLSQLHSTQKPKSAVYTGKH